MSRRAPRTAAILLAAGGGRRMRGAVADKILARLAGAPVFAHSVAAFAASGVADLLAVVYRSPAQRRALERILRQHRRPVPPVLWVRGGTERQDSVARALRALPADIAFVFIHDCARPLIRPEQLRRLLRVAKKDRAAVLAHRVTDTLKQLPAGARSTVRQRPRTLDRARLWAMETPQVFARDLIARAYAAMQARRLRVTDDAAAAEFAGHRLTFVENLQPNPKLTTPADLALLEFLLRRRALEPHRP